MKSEQTRREFLKCTAAIAVARAFRPQTSAARITTIAGTGLPGTASDGSDAAVASINNPFGLVIGPDGALYWADFGSNRVLRLDLTTKKITVVAGNGTKGHSGDGGPAKSAQLSAPHEVRFDSKGNIFVAERDSHVVRYIETSTGLISTAAGTGASGYQGDGGPANRAQLAQPHSIALDKADNVYICDIMNNRVRRIDSKSGVISTFAGTGDAEATPDDAALEGTPVRGPRSIDIAPNGTMYLILREGNKVFTIDPARGRLRRIAGTGELGYSGDGGPAISARFGAPGNPLNGPKGVTYAADNSLYISDTENHVIRRIDLRSRLISTVVGTGKRGNGQDGDPRACQLARPHGVFIQERTVYIGDSENHRIRALELG
jgi:DNA-binding beta-propeller fold protein YncE